MPISIHPKAGQILFCDFSQGFVAPEMVKSGRPVIILTPATQGRDRLVTIVPLSTVEPVQPQPFHYKIPKQSLPMLGIFQEKDSWVKGDMICTVSFHRLNLICLGKRRSDGRREYYQNRLGKEQMKLIYGCVLHSLNLAKLVPHL